jgi:DNA polymerase III sliding clamp (beta) subunit (PCNA family)
MAKQPPIDRADLIRVLTEASMFAIKSKDIPMLNAVRLEATGTHLIAVATDRFVLGVSSAKYEGTPFAITLPIPEVKLVVGACKLKAGRYKPDDVVDLRVTPKGTLLHVTMDETVITVPTFKSERDFQYVDWRKLIGTSTDVGEVLGTVGINPTYLAKFGRIGPTKAKFYLRGPTKPVMVCVGADFVGLIMPIRIPDDDPKVWELPEWLVGSTAAIAEKVA